MSKHIIATGYHPGGGSPAVTLAQTADFDKCEMCGETAVCTTVTVHVDSEAITDMHICDKCRLTVVLRRMGEESRRRVAQLGGENQ